MIGIIVQLALSWLIVWLFEKGNLSFLGLYPTKRRIFEFILFFLITAICCSSGFFLRMYFGKEQWGLNHSITFNLILEAVWWNIKSVLFEELIFRGVIFYILIKKIGSLKALVISAIAFGIYHWFSYEVIGNPTQMAMTFVITGIMGLLYAYGYAKSFSLYIPCAIHLGWNLTQGFVFSQGPIGKGIFIQVMPQPIVNVSYLVFFIILLVPLLSTWLINFLLLRRHNQAEFKS
ncbi:MAG: CPBP family intramembrane glutamic endopeptidase [Chitinophagaceae bacterium]